MPRLLFARSHSQFSSAFMPTFLSLPFHNASSFSDFSGKAFCYAFFSLESAANNTEIIVKLLLLFPFSHIHTDKQRAAPTLG